MKLRLRSTAMRTAWALGKRISAGTAHPIALMYHGVSRRPDICGLDAAAFEEQIKFLVRNFNIVRDMNVDAADAHGRSPVMLTFDDGLRNNAEVAAPILRKLGVPAHFFICRRNTEDEKPLWFTVLKMIERYYPARDITFRGRTFPMNTADERHATVRALEHILLAARPHPAAMYELLESELPPLASFLHPETFADEAAGMTLAQIRELAADPLFTAGAHTADHPLLTLCEPDEAHRQIQRGKEWLEEVCGRPVETFAYPGGVYNASDIRSCREVGFKFAYAVDMSLGIDARLEVLRTGVYYPSVSELGFKMRWGWAMKPLSQARHLAVFGRKG